MDSQDNRGPIAQARRLYLHRQAGGQITARDMSMIVEAMENIDGERTRHRSALVSNQLQTGTQIWRQQQALSPIIRHAAAPDTAPPLRLSVQDCREIKRMVES